MPWPPSDEQIEAVSAYLKAAFPGFEVNKTYEDSDMTHHFRLVQKSERKHELVVGRVIFDDRTSQEITGLLKLHEVAKKLRQAGPRPFRLPQRD